MTRPDQCPYCGLENKHFTNAESFKNHVQTCFDSPDITTPSEAPVKVNQ